MKTVTDNIVKHIYGDSRESYRRNLILEFLKEEHGSSIEVREYNYFVETLEDGNRIYLKRPTQLNKGFDFEVRVENIYFRYGKDGNIISTGNRPSHTDIVNDIKAKKEENIDSYKILRHLIDKIYNCQNVSVEECHSCTFRGEYSVELIIKVLKWLFIEQDITYWNRSGREMLYNGIIEIDDE
ncbi:MAG: hypothetical protein J6J77_00270 [Alistipes sp.]|nr:hypothetical protein [Alistipes sp.]